ncbi:MAG TPA: MFS transporter [Acidimicrobiia bacterium]|nr:MFS transporter [Acidimicrobiia bacterium]
MKVDAARPRVSPWVFVFPLALAQFVASYAGTTMNVAVDSIAKDIGTDVRGVQTAITFFTLTMAALMIPGSKLTDIWGRKRCFVLGLVVYGAGAVIAAVSTSLTMMMVGYSLFEGVGSALMIPPIYILITVLFEGVETRAKFFGVVSAAAGIGAAAGPLIGGVITSAISWRASFGLQVAIVAAVIVLASRVSYPSLKGAAPRFDFAGAVLSAAGLVLVVLGVLQSGTYGWFKSRANLTIGNTVVIHEGGLSPVWLYFTAGGLVLAWFFLHIRSDERRGVTPLLATRLFRNRTSNLGLVTQDLQWLIMQGSFFVVSVYLQTVRHFSAIRTGLVLTPAIAGILVSSAVAQRLAQRHTQRSLVAAGFLVTATGMALLVVLARATSNVLAFSPGLLAMGLGIGVMLTASVNVVQSAFPEKDQGEISGLSRSVSNLGSSLGTALVGSILVSPIVTGNRHYTIALWTMAAIALIGLVAAISLPRHEEGRPAER